MMYRLLFVFLCCQLSLACKLHPRQTQESQSEAKFVLSEGGTMLLATHGKSHMSDAEEKIKGYCLLQTATWDTETMGPLTITGAIDEEQLKGVLGRIDEGHVLAGLITGILGGSNAVALATGAAIGFSAGTLLIPAVLIGVTAAGFVGYMGIRMCGDGEKFEDLTKTNTGLKNKRFQHLLSEDKHSKISNKKMAEIIESIKGIRPMFRGGCDYLEGIAWKGNKPPR